MSLLAVAFLFVAALLTGGACQLIGRSHAPFEWEVGTVGALYGGLLVAGGSGGDGLAVMIPTLLGSALGGGLLVLAFRVFGNSAASRRQAQSPTATLMISSLVKLTFSPLLVEQPIVDSMRRQCGVSVAVERVNITRDAGWVELRITGAAAAVDAAVALAQHAGIGLALEGVERAPAKTAA